MKRRLEILILLLCLVCGLCSCHSLALEGKLLERRLQRFQYEADDLTTQLCQAVETNNLDAIWTFSQTNKNILFYIYKDMQMVYWSNSWLSSSDRIVRLMLDQWHFVQWDNAQGICYRKQVGDYMVVVAIPIKYNYSITTDQLHNSFIPPFRGDEKWTLSVRHNKSIGKPIYSYDGTYLFTIDNTSYTNDDQKSVAMGDAIDNFSYQTLLNSDNKENKSYWLGVKAYYTISIVLIVVLLAIATVCLIRYRVMRHMRMAGKFQVVLTPLIMVILLSIFLVSVGHSRSVFIETQQLRLSKKAQYVQMALQNMYFWDMGLTPANTAALNIDLRDMSFVYETDIHVYDLTGRLVGSSTPQLFDRGILPTHVSPVPFFSGATKMVQYEQISDVKYLSAYTEFINGNYVKLGYIALPSFISEKEMNDSVQAYVNKLLPLYATLLVVSILMVWLISYMVTSSLSMVSMQLKGSRVGETGPHIHYMYNDEVGELVRHYNQIMDALAESTRRLARTEREMAWRTMARQVAHEINNPLTPMKLTLQQLQRMKDTERFDAYFDRSTQLLIDQIDNLSHIAQSFSSFAKMPEVNPTSVDVAAKLSKFITLMRNNPAGIPIRYIGPDEGVFVLADAEQITQVFTNIVRNALQAMEGRSNSDIIIILKKANPQTIDQEQLDPTKHWIKISFSDNGPGIPEEMREKVFVPNFTTKNTGAGLGMPISKNIVEGSGGKICFQTSEKGTTFFVYLRKK